MVLRVEDFNEQTEVLHCDTPGTGLVNAPRAFALKLSQVTKNRCRMIPPSVDGELVLNFEQADNGIGTLICLTAKHVDDIKLTGKKKVIEWVLQQIQEVFGELQMVHTHQLRFPPYTGPHYLLDHLRPGGVYQEYEASYPSGHKRPLIRHRMYG